jgi:hypothetical protein
VFIYDSTKVNAVVEKVNIETLEKRAPFRKVFIDKE